MSQIQINIDRLPFLLAELTPRQAANLEAVICAALGVVIGQYRRNKRLDRRVLTRQLNLPYPRLVALEKGNYKKMSVSTLLLACCSLQTLPGVILHPVFQELLFFLSNPHLLDSTEKDLKNYMSQRVIL